jgi:hypothetical protein
MRRAVRSATIVAVCIVAAWDWAALAILALAMARP